MSFLTLDTLAIVLELRRRGYTEEQASQVMETLRSIDGGALITKADVAELGKKIDSFDLSIDVAFANLKVDVLRWLVVTQVALGGFLFAAMKLTR